MRLALRVLDCHVSAGAAQCCEADAACKCCLGLLIAHALPFEALAYPSLLPASQCRQHAHATTTSHCKGCLQALTDFGQRISEYEKVYEPLTDGKSNRHVHFIQLVNIITGRGHIDINRISGYIPGKIVFFLMQVCRSGLNANRRIWLTRHGESEYNRLGQVGGDAPLTGRGQRYSTALARALCALVPMDNSSTDELLPISCWTSTLRRTIQTARLIPFPKLRWKALDEIHAGASPLLRLRLRLVAG